jgi:hypothetical protein
MSKSERVLVADAQFDKQQDWQIQMQAGQK